MRDLVLLLTAICIASVAGEEVFAQDSSGVTCEMRLCSTWGQTRDLTVHGEYAYVIASRPDIINFDNSELHILDISNPERPIKIGLSSLPTTSIPNWIEVQNEMLFITCIDGLLIYNIEAPLNPILLSFYREDGATGAAAIRGENIFYGTVDSTMTVLDVSDPNAPRRIGSYDAQFPITSLKIIGERAYLTGDEFQIIEILDIEDPVLLARYDQAAFDCDIVENTAILANGEDGVKLIDISNLMDLQEIGQYEITAWKLQALENILYVSYQVNPEGRTHLITSLDISDPENPQPVEHILPQWDWIHRQGDGVHSFAITDDHLYSIGSGFNVWDISDPLNVTDVGCSFRMPMLENITLSQNQLFLRYSNECRWLNVENTASPILISRFGLFQSIGRLSSKDNFLFADHGFRNVQIYDMANPENFEELSRYTVPDGRGITNVIPGEQIFFATEITGFSIVDLEQMWNPREISFLQTGRVDHISVFGDYAYLSGGNERVEIVDISDLENPVELGSIALNGRVEATALSGDNLLVLESDLHIFNLSDPLHPQEISLIEIPGYSTDIKVSENIAFVATRSDTLGGIYLFDISDAENPQRIGFYHSIGGSNQIEVDPPYVFSNEQRFLAVYNYSQVLAVESDLNPNLVYTPVLLNTYPNPFNSTTTFTYTLPCQSKLAFQIYNTRGQLVDELLNRVMAAGKHQVIWEADQAPAGVYLVRMQDGKGGLKGMQKVVLIN